MKKTTWIKLASLSVLWTTAISAPVLAGTSYVENNFSIRNIFRGLSQIDVTVDSIRDIQREASSQASKIGTSDTETLQSLKGETDGFSTKQGFQEVDQFEIISLINSSDTGSESTTEQVRVSDSFRYNGIDKTHRVTAEFDF